MSNNHIIVIAEFDFKPELLEQAKQMVFNIIAPSRNDPGCWYYDFFENSAQNNQFILLEHWTNKPAWDLHLKKDYVQKFIADINNYLLEPLRLRWYLPVNSSDNPENNN